MRVPDVARGLSWHLLYTMLLLLFGGGGVSHASSCFRSFTGTYTFHLACLTAHPWTLHFGVSSSLHSTQRCNHVRTVSGLLCSMLCWGNASLYLLHAHQSITIKLAGQDGKTRCLGRGSGPSCP